MRRLILALTISLLAVALPQAAFPDETPPQCAPTEAGPAGDSDPLCTGSHSSSHATTQTVGAQKQAGPTLSAVGTAGSDKVYVPYNRLSTDANGQPCATTGYVEQGKTPPDERLLVDPNPRETNIPITGNDFKILETYPPCPEQPRAPGQPAPVETKAMVAARLWELAPLPKPRPAILPGRAITGKMAYLETRNEIAHTFLNDTAFGPLQIVARGSYTIDWGDGQTSGPYSYEGTAWPDGRITHEYIDVGTYTILVIEKWTATWIVGGESGALRTLQSSGRIENFPVQQIQAVIGR